MAGRDVDGAFDIELVAFDIAGTTLSVADQVPDAFRYAFSDQDLDVSHAQIRAVRGVSKREAIQELLVTLSPDRDAAGLADRVDVIFSCFKETLLAMYRAAPIRPIPGAESTFEWLRDRGASVALTTGFDRELTQLLLARVGWTDTLDAVVCDDDVERGRPAPDLILKAMRRTKTQDAARVVAVGDTTADLHSAERAGVGYTVGVLSGAHTKEMLRKAPHDAIIASVADLPSVLRVPREVE